MKRKPREDAPRVTPLKHIQLSEKNKKLRWILTAVFLVIAAVAFAVAIHAFLSEDTGWQTVEATNPQTLAAQELSFQYHIGSSAEAKALALAYTEATDHAYRALADEPFENCANLAALNAHPNETLTVEPLLYEALATLEKYNSRYAYFAPLFAQYSGLFASTNDMEAADFDPERNDEVREFTVAAAAFANDETAVRLELLEGNQVCLHVSADYLRFAEEWGVDRFVSLYLLRNAFLLDAVADELIEKGLTAGTITSYDGYARTLDASGTQYSFNLNDRSGTEIYAAAVMNYTGQLSLVSLRDFPASRLDEIHYYESEGGVFRAPYVDLEDGFLRTAASSLVTFSRSLGCAETALRSMPLYATKEFDAAAVEALADDGVESVYFDGRTIRCTDEEVLFTSLYQDENVAYATVAP